MTDYTQTPVTSFLSDRADPLIATPSSLDWQAYARLQTQIEGVLTSLFVETDGVLQLSEYALGLADSALDQIEHSVTDLLSDLQAFQSQTSQIASQQIPLTGGEYTRLITESFRDTSVRDSVSLFGYEPLTLQEPGALYAKQTAALDGLRWDMPITQVGTTQCADPLPVTTMMIGDAGGRYNVTLRFRGVIEVKDYSGGSHDGFWQTGGAPNSNGRNVYRLDISSPAQTYYLNYGGAPGDTLYAGCLAIDYTRTLQIDTGASVTLIAQGVDGNEYPNPGLTVPGIQGSANQGQFLQMNVVSVEPLSGPPTVPARIGCPVRPPLEVDSTTQTLRLRKEGSITAFAGLPDRGRSIGGSVTVDRIYGTPVTPLAESTSGPWTLSVASRSPLARGFSETDSPLAPWIPDSYQGGVAARLRIELENPSPVSEVRLRGSLQSGGLLTQLLETVAVVNSRPDPRNLTSHPVRALNQTWTGSPSLSSAGWQITDGTATRYTKAPDRDPSLYSSSPATTDNALCLNGQAYTAVPVQGSRHYVLRYRAFCPYRNPADSLTPIGGVTPTPPSATFVVVLTYGSSTPSVGSDSPLSIEVFRDDYPCQGDAYAGAGSYTHLVKTPPGAEGVVVMIGTDPVLGLNPFQKNAEIAYSDVWLCDEAITRIWQEDLPAAAESNLQGPSVPGGVKGFSEEDAVESARAALGNLSGGLIITDVWLTIGQASPSLERASSWKTLESRRAVHPDLPPYALSLPSGIPSERASHDPLLLHSARYVGTGPAAWDAGDLRLSGQRVASSRLWPSVRSPWGLWSALTSRSGRRDPLPLTSGGKTGPYWKTLPPWGKASVPDIASLWPRLWAALIALSKARRSPASRSLLLLRTLPTVPADDPSSLYVYTTGLSSLSLTREEYAPSGLYMTQPLQEIGGSQALGGEIREIGLLTDPPLPLLGGRVRFWVVPDSEVQVGTSQDSLTALLTRAIPLDTKTPRVSFHCTAETMVGVSPATSDIVDSWNVLTQYGLSQPSFAVPASQAVDRVLGGLDPDQAAAGLRLSYVPYVNREAIFRVNAALSSGSTYNPRHYDPNAARPLADLVLPGDGGNLYAVTGYRPISLTLTLPNGRKILPDALGKPTPGEVVFSGKEILREASDLETQVLPAAPSVYTYQTGDNPAVSSRSQVSFNRSFVTANSPIAAGDNGASIQLWWHKSTDFNAASGGIQSGWDVEIPASDYEVDTHTGQVRILIPPPGSWEVYDQIVAEYFWIVGDIAPREVFPAASLDSLYTPYVPYLVGGGAASAPQPLYTPTVPLLQGYDTTSSLVADPAFDNQGSSWGVHTTHDNVWNNAGRGSSFNPHIPTPWHYWFGDNNGEGVYQDIAYPGPGTGNLGLWLAYNPDNHSDDWESCQMRITLEVYSGSYSTDSVLEKYEFHTHPVRRGTAGLPCWPGSETDSSNLTTAAPWWFPPAADWNAFRAGLHSGSNQTVYQWPASRMTAAGNEFLVTTDDADSPGAVDNATTFGCAVSKDPKQPWGVQIEFSTPQTGGRKLRVTTVNLNGSNDGNGVMGFRTDVWWTTPRYQQGCVPPYFFDSVTNQCKYSPPAASGATDGAGAGHLQKTPSSVADLLQGPIQQAYPVTRNVTNYIDATPTDLRPANLDPLSPNYYPVFEYRIDPGGVVRFADDFSSLGTYAGTDMEWSYDYLDISPRLIVEILPEGQGSTDLPATVTPPPLRPATDTPELSSLSILLNTRQ